MKSHIDKNMGTVGNRIRIRRKELGYSQEELAEQLYIKKSTICKYEKDQHDIPASVIIEIARALDTTPDYLLLGERDGDSFLNNKIRAIQSPYLQKLAEMQVDCILKIESEQEEDLYKHV